MSRSSWSKLAADSSFNRITVDGDTSTNDSFVLIATGAAGNAEIDSTKIIPDTSSLRDGIVGVARELAQRIIRDAEGATKFVTVLVEGGRTTPSVCRLRTRSGTRR